MNKNYGLILEPLRPEDFVFGSDRSIVRKFGKVAIKPDGDWRPFVPQGELQAPVYETNGCATFGTLNALETLKRFLFNNQPDFSDRMVAKGSGTDPLKGNTPKAPAEYIRKNWTVFEFEWPAAAAKTVQEFYADIPQNLKTLAAGRGAEFDFGYEYVGTGKANLREALKQSPLGMSVPAWSVDKDGKYYRPEGAQDNHWVAALHINDAGEITILDTYEPFIKVLQADFTPQVAMSYYLNRQVKKESAWAQFLAWLHKLVFTNEDDVSLLTIDHSSPTVPPAPEPKYKWDTLIASKHSVRVICDEEGLTLEQKNTLCATVGAESGWQSYYLSGPKKGQPVKLENKKDGKVWSTDWGIAQINDHYHIGPGKSFPSVQYVLDNPDAVIRWMAKQWKAGNRNWWIAYKNGSYKKFL